MKKPEITVLVRADRDFKRTDHYILNHLWNGWEARGHRVRLARGVKEWIPGDIAFVHVDLTVIPGEYLEYASRFPVAINGKVRDISKDKYSSLQLRQSDPWDGRVIVKTRANFGGHNDIATKEPGSDQQGVHFHVSDGQYERPWRKRRTLDPYDYPVFDSLSRVPAGVWRNPHLMVEKFTPELNEDGLFLTRMWHFMGDKGFVRKVASPYHIAKPLLQGDAPGRECFIDLGKRPVPHELLVAREELGFDYGRFDYVELEGRGILFDANPTPVITHEGLRKFTPQFDALIDGIEIFAPSS